MGESVEKWKFTCPLAGEEKKRLLVRNRLNAAFKLFTSAMGKTSKNAKFYIKVSENHDSRKLQTTRHQHFRFDI